MLKGSTATSISAPVVSGVETFSLRAVATMDTGAKVKADASLLPGLTAFNSDRSTAVVEVVNLASGASFGVIGDGTVTNGASKATYVDKATAAVVNFSGGTTGGAVTIVGGGVTSTTINSTGASNTRNDETALAEGGAA